jgi:creatinine amidohydrolase
VTPPLAITASGEHQGFPGTLSIGTEAMTMVVVELARSADWADGIVFVNGHGGNADAMRAAAATMRNEQRRVVTWWPTIDGGDLHAGHTETSLMLAIAPEQVRRDRLAPGTEASIGELLAHGVRALSPNGVLGDATGADAEHGAAVFASLLAQLLTAVDQRFPAR